MKMNKNFRPKEAKKPKSRNGNRCMARLLAELHLSRETLEVHSWGDGRPGHVTRSIKVALGE